MTVIPHKAQTLPAHWNNSSTRKETDHTSQFRNQEEKILNNHGVPVPFRYCGLTILRAELTGKCASTHSNQLNAHTGYVTTKYTVGE